MSSATQDDIDVTIGLQVGDMVRSTQLVVLLTAVVLLLS